MIGFIVRSLRLERQWSIDHLSSLSKISKSALHQIESGVAEPRLTSILALAEAFGEPIESLINRAQRAERNIKISRGAKRRGQESPPEDKVVGEAIISELSEEAEGPQMIARKVQLKAGSKFWLNVLSGKPRVPVFCYVLAGSVEFTSMDGTIDSLTAGDAVHAIANPGDKLVARKPTGATLLRIVSSADKATQFASEM